jgi:hypothetical protein
MKFSIRDIMLVTVIVALAVGWWVDRRQLAQTIKKQNEQLEVMRAQEAVTRAVAEAQAAVEAAAKEALDAVPNASPPAPNPPNN